MGWKKALTGYLDGVAGFVLGRDMEVVSKAQRQALAEEVESARREWEVARRLLDNVTDPRLIDYAIFAAGAAEKRYIYLLEEARRHGVRADVVHLRST
ncbi:MAG TPA: YaaL family protein [Limnochordales bacterium]